MTEYLTGNTISELSAALSVQPLNDIILISEHDRYNYSDYCSRWAPLSVIIEKCQHIIDHEIGIGDMAYAESADYSLIAHSHDDKYNKMSPITREFNPVSRQDAMNYLSIGNYFIDGRISAIYCPLSCFSNAQTIDRVLIEPILGTIRFNANPDFPVISISAADFNGWVYTDGQSYKISDFVLSSQLKTAYGINDKQFRVPLMNRFIKADNSEKIISEHDSNTPITPHQHTVDFAISGNIEATITVPIGQECGHGYAFHRGPKTARFTVPTNAFKATCNVAIDTGSAVTIEPAGTASGYSYPSHNLMPALVYVGKSRYSS